MWVGVLILSTLACMSGRSVRPGKKDRTAVRAAKIIVDDVS